LCAVEPSGSCLMEPSGRWIWIWLVSDMVVIKDRGGAVARRGRAGGSGRPSLLFPLALLQELQSYSCRSERARH
jgi:hypothetical protein